MEHQFPWRTHPYPQQKTFITSKITLLCDHPLIHDHFSLPTGLSSETGSTVLKFFTTLTSIFFIFLQFYQITEKLISVPMNKLSTKLTCLCTLENQTKEISYFPLLSYPACTSFRKASAYLGQIRWYPIPKFLVKKSIIIYSGACNQDGLSWHDKVVTDGVVVFH